jgi:hypothetical protein
MNYRVVLDSAASAELTNLFGLARHELSGQGLHTLVGSDTSGTDAKSPFSDGYPCTWSHPCPMTIVGHDPYLAFGAGAAVGLVVGLAVGLILGLLTRKSFRSGAGPG